MLEATGVTGAEATAIGAVCTIAGIAIREAFSLVRNKNKSGVELALQKQTGVLERIADGQEATHTVLIEGQKESMKRHLEMVKLILERRG